MSMVVSGTNGFENYYRSLIPTTTSSQENFLCIQEDCDFVMVPPSGTYAPSIPTTYPVSVLRRVAAAFEKAEFNLKEHGFQIHRIMQLSDAELDVEFFTLLKPFVINLHMARSGICRDLYKHFKKKDADNLYFQKMWYREYVYARDGSRVVKLNYDRYFRLLDHVDAMRNKMMELAKEIVEYRRLFESIHPSDTDPQEALATHILSLKENFNIQEQNFRNKEAQAILNGAVIDKMDVNSHVDREYILWATVGTMLACLAANYFIPLVVSEMAAVAIAGGGFATGSVAKFAKDKAMELFLRNRKATQGETRLIKHPQLGCVGTYQLDGRSSGFWGALLWKPSLTMGTLTLRTDRHVKQFRFYFNNSPHALRAPYLLELRTLMLRAIEEKKATPAQCMAFLETLLSTYIDRGNKWPQIGFVSQRALQEEFAPLIWKFLITDPSVVHGVRE